MLNGTACQVVVDLEGVTENFREVGELNSPIQVSNEWVYGTMVLEQSTPTPLLL